MTEQVFTRLAPVRSRQRGVFAVRTAVWGLLAGSTLVIGLILGTLSGVAVPLWTLIAIQVAGPVIGFVVGLVWKRTWHGAAVAVDQHYDLKDRTTTALAFIEKGCPRAGRGRRSSPAPRARAPRPCTW